MSEYLFNKVASLMSETLLKRRLRHRSFPVHFAKLFYFKEHLRATASGVFCLSSIYINFYDVLDVEQQNQGKLAE